MRKTFSTILQRTVKALLWSTLLLAGQLLSVSVLGLAQAQTPYGLQPLPTVAGVPFYPNVFGAAATDAAASKAQAERTRPGMPRDVYIGHASGVMWIDDKGEARYSAAVALHSVTFAMSMEKCLEHNGGDKAKCKLVYDEATPVLAVVKSSDGGYYFTKGKSKSEARKKGMEACAQRANVTCEVDKVYGSGEGLLDF